MLHGEIKVNDIVIGDWSATRQSSKDGFNEYSCHMTYRDQRGYPLEARWMLRGHAETNGAVSLAARILLEGMGQLKYRGTTDDESMILFSGKVNGPN